MDNRILGPRRAIFTQQRGYLVRQSSLGQSRRRIVSGGQENIQRGSRRRSSLNRGQNRTPTFEIDLLGFSLHSMKIHSFFRVTTNTIQYCPEK
ncbi:unnamed protein product [Macrosiphum euphorbiae]|uniref:Uncharacterized protein n=1 Tax=Macrosiphum euphorbiae TaxID=13131 RepID=A0AAV0XCI3_9HEMI|nr:unnamed protein product [Macrosiphum euphorbiae]